MSSLWHAVGYDGEYLEHKSVKAPAGFYVDAGAKKNGKRVMSEAQGPYLSLEVIEDAARKYYKQGNNKAADKAIVAYVNQIWKSVFFNKKSALKKFGSKEGVISYLQNYGRKWAAEKNGTKKTTKKK